MNKLFKHLNIWVITLIFYLILVTTEAKKCTYHVKKVCSKRVKTLCHSRAKRSWKCRRRCRYLVQRIKKECRKISKMKRICKNSCRKLKKFNNRKCRKILRRKCKRGGQCKRLVSAYLNCRKGVWKIKTCKSKCWHLGEYFPNMCRRNKRRICQKWCRRVIRKRRCWKRKSCRYKRMRKCLPKKILRKEIWKLTPEEVQKYRDATERIQRLPIDDPNSSTQIGIMHVKNCPHGFRRFFPWHRALLQRYEKALGFPLPYWSWLREGKIPKIFLGKTYKDYYTGKIRQNPLYSQKWNGIPTKLILQSGSLDRTREPFVTYKKKFFAKDTYIYKGEKRTRWRRGGAHLNWRLHFIAPWKNGQMNYVMTRSPKEFSLLFQVYPHNFVHAFVGGVTPPFIFGMRNIWFACFDPLFWAHHSNIDRVWTLYQKRNPISSWPEMKDAYGPPNTALDIPYYTDGPIGKWTPAFPGAKVKDLLKQTHVSYTKSFDDKTIFKKLPYGGQQVHVLVRDLMAIKVPHNTCVYLKRKRDGKILRGSLAIVPTGRMKNPGTPIVKKPVQPPLDIDVTKRMYFLLKRNKEKYRDVTPIYVFQIGYHYYLPGQMEKLLNLTKKIEPPMFQKIIALSTERTYDVTESMVPVKDAVSPSFLFRNLPRRLAEIKGKGLKVAVLSTGLPLGSHYPGVINRVKVEVSPGHRQRINIFLAKMLHKLLPKASIYSYRAIDPWLMWDQGEKVLKDCVKDGIDVLLLDVHTHYNFPQLQKSIDHALRHGIKILTPAGDYNLVPKDRILWPARGGQLITIGYAQNNGRPAKKSSPGKALDFLFKGVKVGLIPRGAKGKVLTYSGSVLASGLVLALSAKIIGLSKGPSWRGKPIINNRDLKEQLKKFVPGGRFAKHTFRKGYGLIRFKRRRRRRRRKRRKV